MKTRIVFYGTGGFAANILRKIYESDKFDILATITQPDRPAGRKHAITESEVKKYSKENNITVLQPDSLKTFDSQKLNDADLAVVAEYGLIIPERLLGCPKYNTVNIHGSILPKYRGASPIQSSILNGDSETGVTLMLMDKKMDHGPVIAILKTEIGDDELFESLYARLSDLGAELFLNDAIKYINGEILPKPQDESSATYCKIINREDGKINFNRNAREIYNTYRAYASWPGIWALYNGKRIKFGKIAISASEHPGTGQVRIDNDRIFISCGESGAIEIFELQLEGKKMLYAKEFLAGERNFKDGKIT